MSNKITIKRSAVPGKIPLPSDLEFGEFAINYADGNLFFKDSSNNVSTLASTQFVSVTGNVTAVGNISGNYFIGNGALLTGLGSSGQLTSTVNNFEGDGSTVTFNLSVVPSSENLTSVNISGVSQLRTAYTVTGNTITFSGAPADGADIEVTTLSGSVVSVGNIANGTSTVAIPAVNGNVIISAGGTSNVVVVSSAGVTITGNINAGNLNLSGVASVSAIDKTGSNGVGNIGSSASTFNTVFAKATSAQYADLAENYSADSDYDPGTVVIFGGSMEITQSYHSHDPRVAGVVSTDPAFLMNSACIGLPVAMMGRVPCRVQGPVDRGDLLVTSNTPGAAQKLSTWVPGCVIGKSLDTISDNSVKVIEVVVGRF